MESSSKEVRQNWEDARSSSTSSPLDAQTHWWGIEGMKNIYDNGLQGKRQGKLVLSFYEEPWLIDTGLSHISGVEESMKQYGLECWLKRWIIIVQHWCDNSIWPMQQPYLRISLEEKTSQATYIARSVGERPTGGYIAGDHPPCIVWSHIQSITNYSWVWLLK